MPASSRSERRDLGKYSVTPVPRIAADEVLNEEAGVHRAVLLGLIGSILGWADRKGDQ